MSLDTIQNNLFFLPRIQGTYLHTCLFLFDNCFDQPNEEQKCEWIHELLIHFQIVKWIDFTYLETGYKNDMANTRPKRKPTAVKNGFWVYAGMGIGNV